MRGSHGRDDAASIPIFAMSANAFVEDRQAAKEAGMDVHIAKPIDAELLKKKIVEYCR
jgi:CheY-like chemotaxis protein